MSNSSASAILVFDIDGVIRDVGNSYRRALADTVEHFTQAAYRPSQTDIDVLKAEGVWNNDWEASQEFIRRYFATQGQADWQGASYEAIVDFFQRRYRGEDLQNPQNWTGYITQEPLLLQSAYFAQLTQASIAWGFFSGATRGSATYVLERRLGLQSPVLVAMEDAPGKPDPTGLFQAIAQLETPESVKRPVLYVGDTVADMYTVSKARDQQPDRRWVGVGVLPPHAQSPAEYAADYTRGLEQAGASLVLNRADQLTPERIGFLLG
jgi:HAD superfamily phosphatase